MDSHRNKHKMIVEHNGRAAFGLTARVDNLRRALNIFGVATTMAAVPGAKG
jgi:hypothetical protein